MEAIQQSAEDFKSLYAPRPDKRLPLMEVFGPTIQGEGAVIGQQTYFLRFGLCDFKCTMCDSIHAVDPKKVHDNARWRTQKEIATDLFNHHVEGTTKWVTFSGGNPCIHDLYDLQALVQEVGWRTHVETQGTFAPPWLRKANLITVSPKTPGMGEKFERATFKHFLSSIGRHRGLNVKVVVGPTTEDLDTAREIFTAALETSCWGFSFDNFYLSQLNPFPPGIKEPPENHVWVLQQEYLRTFDMIKEDPFLSRVKFLPQFHVWLWGNKQGV